MSTSNDYLMFITNDSTELITHTVRLCKSCLVFHAWQAERGTVRTVYVKCTHDLCTKSTTQQWIRQGREVRLKALVDKMWAHHIGACGLLYMNMLALYVFREA